MSGGVSLRTDLKRVTAAELCSEIGMSQVTLSVPCMVLNCRVGISIFPRSRPVLLFVRKVPSGLVSQSMRSNFSTYT